MQHNHAHSDTAHAQARGHRARAGPRAGRVAQSLGVQRHGSLPVGLCGRRGARHGDRHFARLEHGRDDRARGRAGLSVRLRLHDVPLLRSGLAFGAVLKLALAADTVSSAIMEVVDNGIMLVIPGAMEAPLSSPLFWGALAVALLIAGTVAFPVNRWLIARGRGHAVVHQHHGHH